MVSATEKRKAVWTPEKKRPSIFWFLSSLVLPVWGLMVGYRFTRSSSLPTSGPFILSPNHYSEIDPIVMGVATWKLGRQPRFMAKASLFKVPILRWVLNASGQIPVERAGSTSAENPLGAASVLIEKGRGLIVYPEGSLTRDPDLWPMRGKSGAVRLALESGIPLYPAAHWGTQALMPRYGKMIRPFPRKIIQVAVGEPLDLSAFANRPVDQRVVTEATAVLMDAIAELLGELRDEKPPKERWDPSRHEQAETGRF